MLHHSFLAAYPYPLNLNAIVERSFMSKGPVVDFDFSTRWLR